MALIEAVFMFMFGMIYAAFYPAMAAKLKAWLSGLIGQKPCDHEERPFRRQKDHE